MNATSSAARGTFTFCICCDLPSLRSPSVMSQNCIGRPLLPYCLCKNPYLGFAINTRALNDNTDEFGKKTRSLWEMCMNFFFFKKRTITLIALNPIPLKWVVKK